MQYKKYLEKQGLPLSKVYDIRKYLEIYLSDCKKILDIGCGFGEFCQIAKECGKEVYGIDINEEMVKHCREKELNVQKASITNIPFPDEYFDGIYSFNVLEHLYRDELLKGADEISRVLKPHGKCIIIVPRYSKGFWDDPTHVAPFTERTVQRLFNDFSDVRFYNNYIPKVKGLFIDILNKPSWYDMMLKLIPLSFVKRVI